MRRQQESMFYKPEPDNRIFFADAAFGFVLHCNKEFNRIVKHHARHLTTGYTYGIKQAVITLKTSIQATVNQCYGIRWEMFGWENFVRDAGNPTDEMVHISFSGFTYYPILP